MSALVLSLGAWILEIKLLSAVMTKLLKLNLTLMKNTSLGKQMVGDVCVLS